MRAKTREIPYRVYKKMFADCPARDYHDGKITVDFPADYLQSKMYTPSGWTKSNCQLFARLGIGKYGRSVNAKIIERSDGGCKYYEAYVTTLTATNHKDFIRSFQDAHNWCLSTASSYI